MKFMIVNINLHTDTHTHNFLITDKMFIVLCVLCSFIIYPYDDESKMVKMQKDIVFTHTHILRAEHKYTFGLISVEGTDTITQYLHASRERDSVADKWYNAHALD